MQESIIRILNKMKNKNVRKNEPLTIEELRCFEKKNNVRLPKELVLFYTQICNGCIMIDGFELMKMEEWNYHIGSIRKEFPFEEFWIWEDDYDINRIQNIVNGNIEIINIGDSQSWNIIINGKETGKMWYFTDVGIQPCKPSMNFLEWFEFWLDGKDDYFMN